MGHEPPADTAEAFAKLHVALETALGFVRDLAGDQLLTRLVAAFRAMPAQDRPVIIGVLEREVTARVLSRATEKPIGQSTHPNPNARLYIRAYHTELDRRHFDRDEMMIADIRAMRIACLIRNVPEIYATWKDAIRYAMDHVDEETRAVAEQLLHDVLGAIADARAAEHPVESGDRPSDASERTRRS